MKKICLLLLIAVFLIAFTSCECKHEWAEATCTTPQTCTKCGETTGWALYHDYVRVGCNEYSRCSRCDKISSYKDSHSYAGECEQIGTCTYCGEASPEALEHKWDGNVHTGVLSCNRCKKGITETDIQGKSPYQLTGAERAYIYWHLNRYLTATTSYGSYAYTTDEAFQKVAKMFSLSKSYLEQDFWGVNSVYNHNFYSQYYYD